ncbi:MAG: DUF6465 family protein [Lachnospiraceae bacterium]|nr:DUF6465 family protein [Lachnospiraceae bacterium]
MADITPEVQKIIDKKGRKSKAELEILEKAGVDLATSKAAKKEAKSAEKKAAPAEKKAATAAKKAPAKKAAAPKAVKTVAEEDVIFQFNGTNVSAKDVVAAAKANYKGEIKSIKIYVNATEGIAYPVINGEEVGGFNF